jgi:hypothetical protein
MPAAFSYRLRKPSLRSQQHGYRLNHNSRPRRRCISSLPAATTLASALNALFENGRALLTPKAAPSVWLISGSTDPLRNAAWASGRSA